LFLTDIGGIRESQNEIARRVAREGYAVLMPNLFYRTSRPPVLGMPFNPKDEKFTKRLSELASPLTPDAVERDATAYVDFLGSRPGVKNGPMGTFGLCFSGAVALRTAAACPDRIGRLRNRFQIFVGLRWAQVLGLALCCLAVVD